jgi:hypothetical protein
MPLATMKILLDIEKLDYGSSFSTKVFQCELQIVNLIINAPNLGF